MGSILIGCPYFCLFKLTKWQLLIISFPLKLMTSFPSSIDVFTRPFGYGLNVTQGQFLSGVKLVSIQSFPSPMLVAWTRRKNLVCTTFFSIAGDGVERRTNGFMPFLRVLAQSETQKASSRVWTRVTDSTFNDNNRFAKHVFFLPFRFYFLLSAYLLEAFLWRLLISKTFNSVSGDRSFIWT